MSLYGGLPLFTFLTSLTAELAFVANQSATAEAVQVLEDNERKFVTRSAGF
jgi:hypothetical protein